MNSDYPSNVISIDKDAAEAEEFQNDVIKNIEEVLELAKSGQFKKHYPV